MKFKLALGTIAVLAACATAAMASGQNASAQLRFASPVPLATSSSDAPGTKLVTITDPVLNMKAYSIIIPANWIFEGAAFPGSSCSDGPFPVFRMSSPDGLTGINANPNGNGTGNWTLQENVR